MNYEICEPEDPTTRSLKNAMKSSDRNRKGGYPMVKVTGWLRYNLLASDSDVISAIRSNFVSEFFFSGASPFLGHREEVRPA